MTPPTSLKTQALVLSPALQPIPGKLVEKIQKGENLELKELLPDNVALLKRITEVNPVANSGASSSKMREISDPLSWVFCYLSFVAAKSTSSKETRDLLAYGQIVIELARKHAGLGWLTYDSLFRQQLNAGSFSQWNELNPSLMAATVLSSHQAAEPGKWCNLCMASDHTSVDCALASIEPQRLQFSRTVANMYTRPQPRRPSYSPYPPRPEPCRRFNRGNCLYKGCKFEHICSLCMKGGHPAAECRASKDHRQHQQNEPHCHPPLSSN
ncbi:MAG: hypothetical protein K0U52_12045 [Gammaproteobacteria bacterium]|nr:hypothetical protein [Gammaproteobacteria bacterium]